MSVLNLIAQTSLEGLLPAPRGEFDNLMEVKKTWNLFLA